MTLLAIPTPARDSKRSFEQTMAAVDDVRLAIASASTIAEAYAIYESVHPLATALCELVSAALRRADYLLREEL